MSNNFDKQISVAWEELLEGFEDQTILSRKVNIYNTDQTMMARSNDTIWRPQPYIMTSYSGTDMTANFKEVTQMSVPATIGYEKSVPWFMDSRELRDDLQSQRLGKAARDKIASDINLAVMNVAAMQGTLVVARSGAATGYDDVALLDSMMNEQGIPHMDRYLALSSRDYNGMAANLAARQTMTGKPQEAYESSYVGIVSSFETHKLDYSTRLVKTTASGITMSTLAGAGNYYVPQATSIGSGGETSNVDNRYQTITVSSTTNVNAGDAFTIAGVESVNHVAKVATGQLKTFRVRTVINSTTLVISPPIISNQGGSNAEAQYQNVEVTPSSSAALVWLNIATASANPFWHKDAIQLLPGRVAIEENSGMKVLRGTTAQGLELVLSYQTNVDNIKAKYRIDTLFGVAMVNPEMAGIELFGQV